MSKQYQLTKQAHKLIEKFNDLGILVIGAKQAPKRVLIEIEMPPRSMQEDAIEIVEQVNGLRRLAYAARMSGCVVTWKEETRH